MLDTEIALLTKERDAALHEAAGLRILLGRHGESFFFFKDEGLHWNVVEVWRRNGTTTGEVVDAALMLTKEDAEKWALRRGAKIGEPIYTDPTYEPKTQ